ncbi:hypothetical protein DFP73DRAFT_551504 [Morchella snyderi]|nr:hypothetical protein DFP73DRAFT_551504 [Morchella snyderi]
MAKSLASFLTFSASSFFWFSPLFSSSSLFSSLSLFSFPSFCSFNLCSPAWAEFTPLTPFTSSTSSASLPPIRSFCSFSSSSSFPPFGSFSSFISSSSFTLFASFASFAPFALANNDSTLSFSSISSWSFNRLISSSSCTALNSWERWVFLDFRLAISQVLNLMSILALASSDVNPAFALASSNDSFLFVDCRSFFSRFAVSSSFIAANSLTAICDRLSFASWASEVCFFSLPSSSAMHLDSDPFSQYLSHRYPECSFWTACPAASSTAFFAVTLCSSAPSLWSCSLIIASSAPAGSSLVLMGSVSAWATSGLACEMLSSAETSFIGGNCDTSCTWSCCGARGDAFCTWCG